jgi:predicted transcriptional regulator of viral defense system
MRYLELKQQLNNYIVFTLNDIRKIEADFDKRRLNEWQNKGYIKNIRRGFYIFSDLNLNEMVLFLIANKIYYPSYISFEMALSYYNLIPESVYGITSTSSKKTASFDTSIGYFDYHKLKPSLMFGYKLIEHQGQNFKIAEIEKVLLDYFYINSHKKTAADFKEMRFNLEVLRNNIDRNKLNKYLQAFNNKNLDKRIKNFLAYVDVR